MSIGALVTLGLPGSPQQSRVGQVWSPIIPSVSKPRGSTVGRVNKAIYLGNQREIRARLVLFFSQKL